MKPHLRRMFDVQLDQVVAELPQQVRELIDKVPMVVEDYPSREVMREVGVERRSDLCGLYTGIPLVDRSVSHSGIPSDVIHIYREGILRTADISRGDRHLERLRDEIRRTILHEYGHHHGFTEDELRELGYG